MPQLPDPKELVSSMGQSAMRARVQATTSIADSADDAARAVQVEQETGIPSGALLDNPELELDHRAALTANIVDNNPYLQDYINAHPLAAKVSNDDWGSLDEASQRIEEVGHRPLLGQFVEGFKEGFGGPQLGEWMLRDPRGQEFLEKHPNLFLAAAGLGGFVELPAKIFSGGLEGAHYAMREFLMGAGMDESHAESLSRELTALAEYKLISPEKGEAKPKPAKPEITVKAGGLESKGPVEDVAGIEPYVRAGEEPPYGLSEETDKIHEEQLQHDQQAVDKAVKAVQGTATANRSPEMASIFMGVHTDTPVLIPAEAFEKVFGDDIPSELLEEWSAQKQVGGYVSVPFKELVKLDPEVLKELKDSIQYRDTGPSKEDVEVAKEAKKVVEEPEGIEVFHGSPHEFEEFKDEAIGTGEGAQSYGYGHYLAESPEVARNYARERTPGGQGFVGKLEPPKTSLYRARIQAKPEEFLDWDKPLSEQPEAIQKALERFGVSPEHGQTGEDIYRGLETTARKGKLDPALWSAEPSKQLSQKLLEAGVKGIRYLDQQSRKLAEHDDTFRVLNEKGQVLKDKIYDENYAKELAESIGGTYEFEPAKKGTSNYVVFDPSIIKILDRNGQALESVRKAGGLEQPKVLQAYKIIDKETGEVVDDQLPQADAFRAIAGEDRYKMEPSDKPILTEEENIRNATQAIKESLQANENIPGGGRPPPEGEPTTLRTPIFGKGALGLPKTQVDRLQRLIDQRNQEDMERALAKAKTAARKEQEPEWKEKWRENAGKVEEEFNAKPEVRAYKLLLAKILGTKKITKKYTLDPKDVDPVVKAGLPDRFFAKSGKVLTPDQLADLVGASTGKELMQDLAAITSAIGDEPWMDAFTRAVRDETTRRTREQMGDLAENILDAAKDHALGLTQMDLLHEDTVAMGMLADAEMPYEKSEVRSWVKGLAGDLPMRALKADRFLKATGQLGKLIEIALAKKKFAEAFRTAQTREYNALLAREAKRIEKERDKFDTTADRYRKPVKADSPITGEAADMIHAVLIRLGKSVDRSVQQIQDSMLANKHKSLRDFVEKKQGAGEIAQFPEWLFEGEPEAVTDMKYSDFNDAHNALKQLVNWGKRQKQAFIADREVDRNVARDEMLAQISGRPIKHYNADMPDSIRDAIRRTKGVMVMPIQQEFFLRRLDGGNDWGPHSQYMSRGLMDATNKTWKAWKEYGNKFKPLEEDAADWHERIPNTLIKDPVTGDPLRITRAKLRTIIFNMGNPENFKKFVEGWKLDPEQFKAWVWEHATEKDVEWAQKAGKIFKEAGRENQKMWQRLYGYQWDFIDTPPVETPFGVKEGWYAPLIRDAYYEGQIRDASGIKDSPGGLFDYVHDRMATPDGHTKDRTAAIYPVNMDIRRIAGVLRTQLYDTHMREAVVNFNQFLKDREWRDAVTRHFGKHYVDMLDAYIKNVANYPIDNAGMLAGINHVGTLLLRNTISTLISFGLGTVLKHGPTAAVLSARSVGGINFAKAFRDVWMLPGGATIRKFIEENSGEIARRSRAYEEQLFGAFTLSTIGEGKFTTAARKYREWGAAMVAASDNLSSKAQWWHVYNDMLEDTGRHESAVYAADKAVRFSHGSTAVTSRPVAMQFKNPLARSFTALYGFFNDLFNRSYQAAWQAKDSVNDSYDLFRAGAAPEGWAEARKGGRRAVADFMALVVAPAIIEELVSPSSQDEDEPLSSMLTSGMLHTIGSQVPFVREIIDGVVRGRPPKAGMLGTSYELIYDIYKDLTKISQRDAQDHLEHIGDYAQHLTTGMGIVSSFGSRPAGNAAKYWINVAQGIEDSPEGPWEALVGTRFGTTKKHAKTLDEYTSSWPGKVLRPDKWGTE